ncbi:AAA family ATPase [Desulfosporosinus sp. BICA1-9]|uniref:AAA family ATPase n=1 Tax=Desulfosporosinus sp. BICA1-9 TaxID=1531958 RepID=UPI00054B11F6|nr:AAA family ATPase [Desulfosporosinus sp. BICA1-9]KJS50646.1 MAG: hypothetical protein VR66_01690 [Peptococcaceae bacterium BRH_c23]KJS88840.1 MAG: hypothetical protein JL57_10465 [Desulfosporosinus sp. BICA1-9]HBW37739.1 hypothetical protein [Desulfosporosinus sp.]
MEIHSLSLKNYKQFQRFVGDFGGRDEELSPFSIKFLIGNNGSGKTSVMQAIGLIFTRALNDESPGFPYELIYSIATNSKRIYVLLSNNPDENELTERLHIRTSESLVHVRKGTVIKERYSEQANLHPRRIISFATGPNNSLEEVLVKSPLAAINSDIYDELKREGRGGNRLGYLQKLRGQLLYEPNCINFDADNASFILAALMLAEPHGDESENYRSKRSQLFKMVKDIQPNIISFELDEVKYRHLKQSTHNKLRYESLFLDLLECQASDHRVKIVYHPDGTMPKAVRVITISPGETLSGNPTEFLTMLITAQRFGYLLGVHIFYRHEDTKHILDQKSMSDGEFLWLSRMALVILSQQKHDENTLFLFDEPDVFLNENWTMQFISMLHDFAKVDMPGINTRYNRQEYWIATHSTLILTDAFQDQTFMIEAQDGQSGTFKAISLTLPTFGADRGEVSAQLFMEHERIGEFAKRVIDKELAGENPYSADRIQKMIDKIGPGYERFRLEEYLQAGKHLLID